MIWPVPTIPTVAALAFLVGSALGGWISYEWVTGSAAKEKVDALQRQAQLNSEIAAQDAEITTEGQTAVRVIYKTKEKAHEGLDNSAVPVCSLDADGLRSVQSVYSGDTARAEAFASAVRGVEATPRWSLADDKPRTD